MHEHMMTLWHIFLSSLTNFHKYNALIVNNNRAETTLPISQHWKFMVFDMGSINGALSLLSMKYIKTRMLIGCQNWEIGGSTCFSFFIFSTHAQKN